MTQEIELKILKTLSDSESYDYEKLKTQLELELKRKISFSEFDHLLRVLEKKGLIEKIIEEKKKYKITDGGLILLTVSQKLEELLASYEDLNRKIREILEKFKYDEVDKLPLLAEDFKIICKEIVRLLTEFFQKKFGMSMSDKIRYLLRKFEKNYRSPYSFYSFSTKEKVYEVIAMTAGCSIDYVRRLDTYKRKMNRRVRKIVLERDNFSCLVCGGKDVELHHIIPLNEFAFPESADHPDNLATLCKECHCAIHGGNFGLGFLPYESKEEFYEIIKNPFWVKLWPAVCKAGFYRRDIKRVYRMLCKNFRDEESFMAMDVKELSKLPYLTEDLARRIKEFLQLY